ncbi:ABC transporter permease [Garciella nitratireducens]|uniref:Putative ABC transport system permease protein n=1 Tax=Garciella nitratireducens DSM 15102 TaxID=1121911 RepID=A0A1T4KED8_9FIRM|nr:ABC transporter permease [Garciella nitratireducens]SJZ40769.1 putative ABC transport system permease protein [Garciella nitratireducens DSM 15102]
MKIEVLFRTAFQSLRQNARRSLLTMFGIVIGIASVICIISIGKGFQKETISNLTSSDSDQMSVVVTFLPNNPMLDVSRIQPFSRKNLLELTEIKGVDRVEEGSNQANIQFADVLVKNQNESQLVGLVKEQGQEVIAGQSLTIIDNDAKKRVVVIREDTAKKLYGSADKSIGKMIKVNGIPFYIKGIAKALDSYSFTSTGNDIEIPEATYQQYFHQQQNATELTVFLENGVSPKEISDELTHYLQENGATKNLGSYTVIDMSQIMEAIGKVIDGLTYFISAIAGISLFIAGVGVMNMMYISVSERTKEIGIRRSLGATEASIQCQFLLEGLMITTIGGIIGYLFGIGLAYLIAKFLPFDISIDLFTILLAIGVSMFIGIVFSVMPARTAAKKDVVEILR